MLKISDLKAFSEEFKTLNPSISQVLFLVDDDDYSKFVKEISTTTEQALLITVLPSATLDFKDKDNYRFNNYLHFFVVQKSDAKEGYDEYFNHFEFCQPLMIKLFNFIYEKTEKFKEPIFQKFDLAKTQIDPVTEKIRTFGYSISIPLKTK